MQMIVITTAQNTWLLNYKQQWVNLLSDRSIDFVPVKIATDDGTGNSSYILPTDLLTNYEFKEIKDDLQTGGHLANIVIRDVSDSEFLVYNI